MHYHSFRFVLTAAVLSLILAIPAAAYTSEQAFAAAELSAQGIMIGDSQGDMRLDAPLDRSELAALLTRLHGGTDLDPSVYTWACYYTDVPEWARPYVGYCTAMLLVSGYGNARYGSGDLVTQQMACTVILRLSEDESGWSYETACDHAYRKGLLKGPVSPEEPITRGEMAVLICRALGQMQEAESPALPSVVPDGVVTSPEGVILSKTITQASWSRMDFSQEASPAAFVGNYSRSWYNAIRQSIVDQDAIQAEAAAGRPTYLYAHTIVPDKPAESFTQFSQVLGCLQGLYSYSIEAEPYTQNQYAFPGYAIVRVLRNEALTSALDFVQPELDSISGLDAREKVAELNRYLCDLLEYQEGEAAGIVEVFSPHTAPALGKCGSYANGFKFLCDAAGIPCVIVRSEDHAWNEVYVDGRWLVVDVTFNDASFDKTHYLLIETAPHSDLTSQATRFAQELLVPGSTG